MRNHFDVPGLLLALALALATPGAQAADLPIVDAHIHYSHDAWPLVPPKDAIAILRKAGLKRAMVSSSNDDGTQMLLAEAPDLIVPVLRPYRNRSDVGSWVRDESVIAHLEQRLKKYRYVGIGEFHAFGADIELPVMRRVIALAREHRLLLHAHSDADAIERIFRHDPEARVLWAHSGFDRPERVRAMLRRFPLLWSDLAFRTDQASAGKVTSDWRAAFEEFPTRFMVGTDTFTPERWHFIGEHAKWSRAWLADLPADLAEKIAYRNADALIEAVLKDRGP